MEEKELEAYAKQFLTEEYNLALTIPVKRNNRLRSTYGRYIMTKTGVPLRIEVAGRTMDYGTKSAILGILKHECIHYALHMQGKDLKDGHPSFEAELRKHGAPSTNTLMIGIFYIFKCKKCHHIYETNKKQVVKTPGKYRTKCCQSVLQLVGESIYNGENK